MLRPVVGIVVSCVCEWGSTHIATIYVAPLIPPDRIGSNMTVGSPGNPFALSK